MKKKLTKEQLLVLLIQQQQNDDTEVAHAKADNLVLEYIDDPEITEAYNKIDKWYA